MFVGNVEYYSVAGIQFVALQTTLDVTMRSDLHVATLVLKRKKQNFISVLFCFAASNTLIYLTKQFDPWAKIFVSANTIITMQKANKEP